MNDDERHQLLCQLRLLRLLGALPPGAVLSAEERACVAAALEIERNLRQQCEQANNLEGGLAGMQVLRAGLQGACWGSTARGSVMQSAHDWPLRQLHNAHVVTV